MGTCIICGTELDGHVCDLHEEDVLFEFRGTDPNQLTTDRYYRGTVDGFAEFGVFVDIGESVTGLLHRSELDTRLESLDWDPGDDVFVKVKNVRDNGNVDLGWSIRQAERAFRGTLVDDPEFDHPQLVDEVDESGNANGADGPAGSDPHSRSADRPDAPPDQSSAADRPDGPSGQASAAGRADGETAGVATADADRVRGTSASVGDTTVDSTDGPGTGDATPDSTDGPGTGDATPDSTDGPGTGDATPDSTDGPGTGDASTPSTAESGTDGGSGSTAQSQTAGAGAPGRTDAGAAASGTDSTDGGAPDAGSSEQGSPGDEGTPVDAETIARVPIGDLADHEGETVRIEGEVLDVRQTSGPTVFEISDESGTVECAAFVEAGVRAFPDVVEADVVSLVGEVDRRRGDLQVETETVSALEGPDRSAVEDRIDAALEERAAPADTSPVVEDADLGALETALTDAATAIRKSILDDRPVVVRHSATADGYAAGVALERAALPLVREEHRRADAEYHYFDRRPLEGGVYDMDDATKDATRMLEDRDRHDEPVPLFVFVAAGGTAESLDGFELLGIYDAPRVVVDDAAADEAVVDAVDTVVGPAPDDSPLTATVLAANVAGQVNESVRSEVRHLPAVSFWDDVPAPYLEAAAETGYQPDRVRELRHAVALEAFYQSYEDKRELVADLLFGDASGGDGGLAANVAEQFRAKRDAAVETAEANLETHASDGATFSVLDVDAFTHPYDFPPATLLLDELARRRDDDVAALVGLDEDSLYVRADTDADVYALAEGIADRVPDAGVTVQNAREWRIRFLAGERDAVREAAIEVLADQH